MESFIEQQKIHLFSQEWFPLQKWCTCHQKMEMLYVIKTYVHSLTRLNINTLAMVGQEPGPEITMDEQEEGVPGPM